MQVNNAGSWSWFSSAFKGNISSSLVLFIALCSSMQLLTKDPFGKISSWEVRKGGRQCLKIFNFHIFQQWQWEVAKLAPSQGCQDDGWNHLSVKLILARCFSAKKRYLPISWQNIKTNNFYFQFTCNSKKTSWHRSEFRLSEFCFCQGMSMADKNIFRDGAELTEKNSRLCQWWLADLTTSPESGMNVQRW